MSALDTTYGRMSALAVSIENTYYNLPVSDDRTVAVAVPLLTSDDHERLTRDITRAVFPYVHDLTNRDLHLLANMAENDNLHSLADAFARLEDRGECGRCGARIHPWSGC